VTDDELRDELAEAWLTAIRRNDSNGLTFSQAWDALHLVVRRHVNRYADAQVAAERERIAAAIEAGLDSGVIEVAGTSNTAEVYIGATRRAAHIARGQP
jgi:ketosteroid isomerase-like protein